MSKTENMADLMAAYEAELEAKANTPEAKAEWDAQLERNAARVKAEHARHVALGWCDEDGNSLLPVDDEDEDDDE